MVTIADAYLRKGLTKVGYIPINAYIQDYNVLIVPQTTTTEYVGIEVYVNGVLTCKLPSTIEITPATQGVSVGLAGGVPGTDTIVTLQQLLNYVKTPNATQLTITAKMNGSSKSFAVAITQAEPISITKIELRYRGNVVTSIDHLDDSCVWYELWVYVNNTTASTINARIHITMNGTEVWYQKFSVPPGDSIYKFEFCELGYKFKVSTVGDLIKGLGNPSNITICATWELL